MKGTLFFLVCWLGATWGVPAAALEITAEVDRDRAAVGEHIVLTVTVTGNARSLPQPVPPPSLATDFEMIPQGTSRNISLVNGTLSSSLAHRFVLIPRTEGSHTIGAFTATGKDETVSTTPLTVLVTAAAPIPVPAPSSPGETGSISGNDEIFARATVDNATPYVNEQVTYRVRLYSRVHFLDNPSFNPPTTEGFWKEDLPHREPYTETVEGQRYQVLEVGVAVFPTTPGTLTIGESVLECSVGTANRNPRPIFGSSFRDGKRVVLRTDPLQLQVRPLPAEPDGFTGAVGDFTFTAFPDKREISQDDPLTVSLSFNGRGNLRVLGDLQLPEVPGFRAYPEKGTLQTNVRNGRWGGTLSRQFVLVPLTAGELTIPPVEMTVFSPESGSYRVVRSEPFTVRAAAGVGGEGTGPAGTRSGIEVVGSDIRFIETRTPVFRSPGWELARVRGWLLLLPFPAVAYAGLWFVLRRRATNRGDEASRRRARAAKQARQLLRRLPTGEQGGGEAAGAAVRGYFADRYNLPPAGLTFDRLERLLHGDGLESEPVRTFLDRADALRFAPQATAGGDSLIEEALRLIDRWEEGS